MRKQQGKMYYNFIQVIIVNISLNRKNDQRTIHCFTNFHHSTNLQNFKHP